MVVPAVIIGRDGLKPALGDTCPVLALQAAGLAVFAIGLLLFFSSLHRFSTEGEGTLAPWDPPRRLVVRGSYRFVRNRMISGVTCILAAEAMLLVSLALARSALIFLAMNLVYIPLVEEPGLRARFGDAYREHCRHVPRVVLRLKPWRAERGSGAGS